MLASLCWPAGARAIEGDAALPRLTWGAAALISVCYYLSQSAWLAGLGFWTLYRPLVGGALVGLILGDPWAGARAGATINLAYLGFIATGGALPSDISLAGYLGAVLVVAGGLDERTALALTMPVGLLGYLVYQVRMALDVFFVHQADRAASRGDAWGVAWANVGPPQALLFVLSAVPCFLGVYYGPGRLGALLALLPEWVPGSLQVVGGLLPGLGVAMALGLFWRGANRAFFVLAFVVSAVARVPLLAFGLMAAAVAVIVVHLEQRGRIPDEESPALCRPGDSAASAQIGDARADGPLLRQRDLWASWLCWLFFSHASYNYERMQGAGFAHSMIPVLRRLHPDRESLAEGLERHLVFYNAEPNVGAFVNGVVAAMEEARAGGRAISEQAINACKVALMGPISGIGDTLIQGTLAPVLLSLGAGLALQGSLLGPALYVVLISGTVWALGWGLYLRGYHEGRARVLTGMRRGSLQQFLAATEIVACSVLGALSASVVQLRTRWVVHAGGMSLRMQDDVLDKVLPQALSLVVVLGYLALLRRRVAPVWLVAGTFALGLAARLLGWL